MMQLTFIEEYIIRIKHKTHTLVLFLSVQLMCDHPALSENGMSCLKYRAEDLNSTKLKSLGLQSDCKTL